MSDIERAFENGRAWFAEIVRLLADLDKAGDDDNAREGVEREIHEGPLSIQVRDGWHSPGGDNASEPEEYEILLSTGGPALRIYGRLGQYNEPASAELQAQDWGTPWTRVPDCEEETLLSYARNFYYGEG